MIRIDRKIIEGLEGAAGAADLHYYLQKAVELEHSTIPPYLTAMFSLKPGTNRRIGELIRSIVNEEMLHMTIAANILIATGGSPQINTPDFVPAYPGPLPMNVGDLTVGIEAFSISLTKNTFMAIEEPEHPIPVRMAESEEFATIGAFYDAIQRKIRELGDEIFVNTTAPPQVVSSEWFSEQKLFVITDVESACRAIDLVKIEGEGTSASPFEEPGNPAHYYKFGEIVAGREIEQTPGGYAYSGEAILFEPSGVWPLKPNCKIADFPVGTQARTRIEQFAYGYSTLLNALHETFNGDPSKLDAAIGMMYDLRVLAAALMQTDAGDGSGLTVGPSFEFVSVQGGMPTMETPANSPLSLTSTWFIAQGNEAAAIAAVKALAKDVEASEPDTLIYLVHTPFTDDKRVTSLSPLYSGTIVFFEMYRTVEAFLRHVNGPIFADFLAKSGNLFVAQNGAPFTFVAFLARQAGFVRAESGPMRGIGVNRHPSVMFEIIANDQPGLKAFYSKVFGWNYAMGSNDFAYVKFPVEKLPLLGGIGKADPSQQGFGAGHQFYLLVEDLQGAIDAAVAAGGSEYLAPATLDGYEIAMIKDPEGNPVGMIKPFQAPA
jgi:predicted enzyme related to lactoylglutathione lyase/quinol monooxygenase YgiN